ncbi:MAG TPA: ATP synthase subunit I [Tissierellia bacterium]|nr:ATP synthase subunit I [Tissierellia bacterium]
MNNNRLSYYIIRRTVIYSLFATGVFFGFKEPKPLVLGFIFGTSIGILGFKLLELTINKAVTMPPEKAFFYAFCQYIMRYMIYGIVLAVAALADYLSLVTAIIGLLMIKIVILTSAIFNIIPSNKTKGGENNL